MACFVKHEGEHTCTEEIRMYKSDWLIHITLMTTLSRGCMSWNPSKKFMERKQMSSNLHHVSTLMKRSASSFKQRFIRWHTHLIIYDTLLRLIPSLFHIWNSTWSGTKTTWRNAFDWMPEMSKQIFMKSKIKMNRFILETGTIFHFLLRLTDLFIVRRCEK